MYQFPRLEYPFKQTVHAYNNFVYKIYIKQKLETLQQAFCINSGRVDRQQIQESTETDFS